MIGKGDAEHWRHVEILVEPIGKQGESLFYSTNYLTSFTTLKCVLRMEFLVMIKWCCC